jgi:aryl-alcohol dehydrogenase-like predicted oxidoreductase
MAQLALRWILMFPEVSAAIPGAKNALQVQDNVHAAELPPLSQAQMITVRSVYDRYVRQSVHSRW